MFNVISETFLSLPQHFIRFGNDRFGNDIFRKKHFYKRLSIIIMLLLNIDSKEVTNVDSNIHIKRSNMHLKGQEWSFGNDV